MKTSFTAAAPILLIFCSLAPAAETFVPAVQGRPVSPEFRALGAGVGQAPAELDQDLQYPPARPDVRLRAEWLKAQWGCAHLSPSELADEDIDNDPDVRVRVAVHHTETFIAEGEKKLPAARSAAAVKTLLCSIRNYHMSSANSDGYPWSDIGYHYLIDWDGRIWQGRKLEKQGANVSSMNQGTIGIALFGDFERQRPTPAQVAALKKMLAYLVYAYKISPMAIHGHHEYVSTQCPGRYLERRAEYDEPYDPATASPLRKMRMALIPLWGRMRADSLVAEAPADVLPESESGPRLRSSGW